MSAACVITAGPRRRAGTALLAHRVRLPFGATVPLGADAYVYGSAEFGGERRPIIARVDGRRPPEKGSVLHLAPQQGHMHLFRGDNGERIDLEV